MSEITPTRRRTARGLFLIMVALLGLVLFFAWTVSRRTHPAQSALSREPGIGARRASPQRQSRQPPAAEQAAALPTAGQRSVQRILKYGRGEGELGMVHEREQGPVGPESFAVTRDGSILVADVVNQRVVVYSRDGSYLRSIAVPGIALGDVAADAQGRVYVYDQARRALHQYDADGTPRSTLDLNPKDIDTRGYFHIAGSAVYFADAAARDVLVATIEDGGLMAADQSAARTTDGIHGESERIYSLSLDKGQALRLQVREPAEPAGRTLDVPVPGILSARYAGEDEARRFYVQTERVDGSRIALEVLTFSPAGEQLAATPMPEDDYAIWTARLVDVRGDGTIVQFLPQQSQAKLNLFTN
jgi:hypothetical protein